MSQKTVSQKTVNQRAASAVGGHVPGIDGLRALAVLSVMLFHARASALPGGFTGVDVFFVISGYVVSASLAKDSATSLRHFLAAFYARRLIRIYPALLVCLLASFLLLVLFVPQSWLSGTTWKTGFYAFFGFSNVALMAFSDGYFSPRIEFNIFVHTWSLGVEEQFYLLYPLLFFAWLRAGRGLRASLLWLGLPALASLGYAAWASAWRPEQAFYLLPSRLWELAAGGLLMQAHAAGRLVPNGAGQRWLALGAGLLLVAVGFVHADAARFPFPWAVLPVAGTLLCIAAAVGAARAGSAAKDPLAAPVLVYIGKISFSLYLWHWPVYVLFRWTVGMEGWHPLLATPLVFALAAASYHGVEVPLRHSLPRLAAARPWFIAQGLALIALCAALGVGLWISRAWTSLSVVNRHADVWYPTQAPLAVAATTPAAKGEFAGRQLFVIGDSHVPAYSLLLRQVQADTGLQLREFWDAGCAAAALQRPSTPACATVLQRALAETLRLAKPGDIAFLPGLRTPRLGDQWAAFDEAQVLQRLRSPEAAAEREAALREAEEQIGQLERAGLVVLFELPKPTYPAPPYRCADWFNASNPICAPGVTMTRERLDALAQPTRAGVAALQARHPAMRTFDPTPWLCPQAVCSAFDPAGLPLFADGDHLSGHGNRVLRQPFVDALRAIWTAPLAAVTPS